MLPPVVRRQVQALTLLFCCGALLSKAGSSNVTNVTVDRLFDSLFWGYDARLPPKYYSGLNTTGSQTSVGDDKRVDVYVNMMVVSLYDLSEVGMDYSMSMFLRERWVEPRFKYEHLAADIKRIELDLNSSSRVWVPDMYILNEKQSDFHEVTVPNKMMHVYPDGTIQYSMRVTGTFSCQMDLLKYPFDTQECHLEFESYGHSTESVKFVWLPNAVTVADGLTFPQFILENVTSYSCDKDYFGSKYTESVKFVRLPNAVTVADGLTFPQFILENVTSYSYDKDYFGIVYPCIGVKFVFVRDFGYYIAQIYIPSFLVVLLSWVNFWLDCEAVPARISLGLLTVLTMTTQSSGARADLPRVSYLKAIDVWMTTCLIFVFAALLEFAYVNVLCRRGKRRSSLDSNTESVSKNGSYNLNGSPVDMAEVEMKEKPCSRLPCFGKMTGLDKARSVDKLSRILFPLVFLSFNIFYWLFYFLWEPEKTIEV